MEYPKQSAQYHFRATRDALQAEKLSLLLKFCRAAIAERERGEMELWQVGTQTLTLIVGISAPPVKLLDRKLASQDAILDELHSVAGTLDMAAQGATTKEADEKLWQRYKELVDEYEDNLTG